MLLLLETTYLSWVSLRVSSFKRNRSFNSPTEKCLSTSSSLSTTQLLRAFLWAWRWKIFSSIVPVWKDRIQQRYMYLITSVLDGRTLKIDTKCSILLIISLKSFNLPTAVCKWRPMERKKFSATFNTVKCCYFEFSKQMKSRVWNSWRKWIWVQNNAVNGPFKISFN